MACGAVLVAVLLAGGAGAQGDDPVLGSFSFTSTGEPIQITSNRLDFDYKKRKTVFQGSVNVVQGEIILDCDMLTVSFRETEGGQTLENVAADGNVKIRQGNARPRVSEPRSTTWRAHSN